MKKTRSCPRTNCTNEMILLHIAETDFELVGNNRWTYVFYYCSHCNRSLMVSRTTEIVLDKEERI